jgi:hypothetical protein
MRVPRGNGGQHTARVPELERDSVSYSELALCR